MWVLLYLLKKRKKMSDTPNAVSHYDRQSFMTCCSINENEKKNYSSKKCDTNAMKLALKLKKLNPKVICGYRSKTLPIEEKLQNPHFIVEIKDKVWEISYNPYYQDIYYLISDKKKYFDFHGFKVVNVYKDELFWQYYIK